MVIRTKSDRQMDMFSMLEAPMEPQGELQVVHEDVVIEKELPPIPMGKIPEPMPDEAEFTAEKWLRGMISAKEHMVFLFGRNPGLCQVKCESSWERRVPHLVARSWLMRKDAKALLSEAKYVKHSNYSIGEQRAEVFVRWWN